MFGLLVKGTLWISPSITVRKEILFVKVSWLLSEYFYLILSYANYANIFLDAVAPGLVIRDIDVESRFL